MTGGAGFIGSHLVEALLSQDFCVRVFDNFSAGSKINLDEAIANYRHRLEVMRGDVRNPKSLSGALQDIDVVFHLAAACQWATLEDPILAHTVNAEGTLNLCSAVRRSKARLLVHVSSSEVYGDACRLSIDESHSTRPKTPYAASKLAGEAYVNAFEKTFGIRSVILRPFNTFGPRQRGFRRHESDRYGGMVSKCVYSALHRKEPVVYGDGKQTRDYMYVKDCVRGIVAAAREDLRGQVLNLATGKAISIAEIVRLVGKITGNQDLNLTFKPERPGDVRHQLGDISLAQRLIGFKPAYDFVRGLKEYVDWARSQ